MNIFLLHFLTAYFKLFMIFPFVIRDVYICINIPLYIFLQIPCPCSPEFCVGMILWKNATHSCYIGYVYLKPCQCSIYAQARLSSGWRKIISIILKLYMILVLQMQDQINIFFVVLFPFCGNLANQMYFQYYQTCIYLRMWLLNVRYRLCVGHD